VADGNLITGQNPASAETVAKKLLAITPRKESIPAYYNPSLT
jgi:putative intracellular protease/amidase